MSLGDKEESESFSPSEEPILLPSLSEPSVSKQTDNPKFISLPSQINMGQADTMDNSNCATSPSKQTCFSSIPGTIYYNGLDSVTQPHIQNARKVSELDSASQLFAENPPPQKIRPTPQQNNSVGSSVPRMQWTPPQPLAGNGHQVQPSRPQYAAQPYKSSAMHDNAVPAVPVEELSMDGFTDTVLKHEIEKVCCGKVKGYKVLLILTAVVIFLAISAVVFSIVYVTGTGTGTGTDKENKDEKKRPKHCRPDCYNPLRPRLICRCDCYTKEDDKYYTCSSQTEYYYPLNNDDNHDDNNNELDNEFEDEPVKKIDNDDGTSINFDPNNDSSSNDDGETVGYFASDDDYYNEEDDFIVTYDDSLYENKNDCSTMCYRQQIHREWNPTECHPSCYNPDFPSEYESRYELWLQWFVTDDFNDESSSSNPVDYLSASPSIVPTGQKFSSNIFAP